MRIGAPLVQAEAGEGAGESLFVHGPEVIVRNGLNVMFVRQERPTESLGTRRVLTDDVRPIGMSAIRDLTILLHPFLQAHCYHVSSLFAYDPADVGLYGQHVSTSTHSHEGTAERMTVYRAPHLYEPTRVKKLY